MNDRVASGPKKEQQSTKRARVRGTPKGRSVDPKAPQEVRGLLKDTPRRRDLLIAHLHRIQEHYCHISALHLVAAAERECRKDFRAGESQGGEAPRAGLA